MAGDYKYEIQMIAEQKAIDIFDKDFYDLPEDVQYNLFLESELDYSEGKMHSADFLRDALDIK